MSILVISIVVEPTMPKITVRTLQWLLLKCTRIVNKCPQALVATNLFALLIGVLNANSGSNVEWYCTNVFQFELGKAFFL